MKRNILLALIVLGMISCKKEEVEPDTNTVAPIVVTPTPTPYEPDERIYGEWEAVNIWSPETGDIVVDNNLTMRLTKDSWISLADVSISADIYYHAPNKISDSPNPSVGGSFYEFDGDDKMTLLNYEDGKLVQTILYIRVVQQIETNHVKITFNNIEVMDSIRVIHGINSALSRITIINDAKYYVCNMGNSVSSYLTLVNDCNDGYLELIGTDIIYVEYKGNVDVEYF